MCVKVEWVLYDWSYNTYHHPLQLQRQKVCTLIISLLSTRFTPFGWYVNIFAFSTVSQQKHDTGRWNSALWNIRELSTYYSQYHDGWCPGKARSQGSSSPGINSLRPSDAYASAILRSLVQIIACSLDGAKQPSVLMRDYCLLDS